MYFLYKWRPNCLSCLSKKVKKSHFFMSSNLGSLVCFVSPKRVSKNEFFSLGCVDIIPLKYYFHQKGLLDIFDDLTKKLCEKTYIVWF